MLVTDFQGRTVRLTAERWQQILEHPEMSGQQSRLRDTVQSPHLVVHSGSDESVYFYHRLYDTTPVTRKYLGAVVKVLEHDAFIITAYLTSRPKRGQVLWQQ